MDSTSPLASIRSLVRRANKLPLVVAWTWGALALAAPQSGQKPSPDPDRPVSVLVLDFLGNGHQLTSIDDGVTFDIDGRGVPTKVAWTQQGGDDAFLFLDANGNGRVDNSHELIGNGWRLEDGSRSRSVDSTLIIIQGYPLPAPGTATPPGMGAIDREDAVYSRLRVWRDVNHNGQSDSSELDTLERSGITEILLLFRRLGSVTDDKGNVRLNEGSFMLHNQQGVTATRRMLDVVLARR